MNFPSHINSKGNLIPLNNTLMCTYGREKTESELRSIVRSVKFELLEQEGAFRILGPDMPYHNLDPYLSENLGKFKKDMDSSEIISYRSSRKFFDLCFEDSWSGYFVADELRNRNQQEDLVFIHLDDHTDMMSTLLECSGDVLKDPTSDKTFDPTCKDDWESSIYSGCVGIGSFITPLYYSGKKVHVRHLNNFPSRDYNLNNVTRESIRYELIPDKEFAAIQKITSNWNNSAGTYLGGVSADKVLKDLPQGQLIVHIDLDYFINDFNGNDGTDFCVNNPDLRYKASKKMESFFDSLSKVTSSIDRWIIGTSPGFCSAYHWDWLLTQIEAKIEQFESF